jgi:metal dependent phosphohydrolase
LLLFAVCGAVPTDLCYNHSRIKTNQEMDIVTVDRQKVLDAFAAYIRPYDAQDPKVSLKIHHTYRVAALCEQIGRSIALEGTALDLAWLCGMLHDVGRFEQLRRFGTFDDSKSIDHARAGVQVLFEQGHIRDYLDDDSEDAMLRTAVEWHSAYRLPDGLDERTVMYCNILRDADKIDILRVNVETPLEDIYNVTTAELLASPVTPAVQQAFYAHHAVLRSLKQHPADHAVGHSSLVYELVYPESRCIVADQGWLWKLMDFKTHNPETATAFALMREHMHQWLAENT